MADLLPSAPDPSAGDGGDPRVIGVDSEDAADLLSALQSETAREILAALYDDPATPSALADAADTSIQNVRYHLEKLTDADLVEVADTVYSEKGREMSVYAPAAKPLVVFAGGDGDAPGVEAALSRLLGALGILGLSSLLVQRFFGGGAGGGAAVDFQGQSAGATTEDVDVNADYAKGNTSGDDAAATTAESGGGAGPNADGTTVAEAGTTPQDADATEAATEATRTTVEEGDAATTVAEATRTAADAAATTADELARSTTTVADGAGTATAGLPPGLVFFLGGAVVLAALGIAWYVRAR